MTSIRMFSGFTRSGLIALAFLGFAHLGLAQESQDLDPARPALGQQGKLFVLQFAPASRRLTVDFAGKNAAVLDPNKIVVFGKTVSGDGKIRPLRLKAVERHFEFDEALGQEEHVEFTVKDPARDKQETFKFKTKPTP